MEFSSNDAPCLVVLVPDDEKRSCVVHNLATLATERAVVRGSLAHPVIQGFMNSLLTGAEEITSVLEEYTMSVPR